MAVAGDEGDMQECCFMPKWNDPEKAHNDCRDKKEDEAPVRLSASSIKLPLF